MQELKSQTAIAGTAKRYDLEDRTLRFAKRVIQLVNALPKTISNIEISRQVVRSSGSVGANYIEANEALSKKDFLMRVRIARKEAKETRYWLELLGCDVELQTEKDGLIRESTELLKILSAIISKSE